ncbi:MULTISPECIES: MraY family glycosyltransferase [Phyllobacteriaceae]|jgi:UDP-N-acetylmuramyl pentapeptide phosphotransferase/UDP-N-acetylglucosamine-1-phosphate transferase|uniref:Glycosyl transferase n=1 Tax=Mesorhizobium hungaricum TaxID=1566387 RepID=A0A1C2DJ76_9HYPH|nr:MULTISPECIES: glycosyltransferase family 4 protein [Mesorhizobium]MBN9233226.1 glycosyltransferase family 4 protein [Mesorhizobium sp.]MDQ0332085.1 UDP-N-acetylmuramyl pentapeptide phosphotransferase/UDP-N-acetylglucosamine-1-phosphate transferase [Mesorhizobium sp. YL-MeA3-2017]OCX14829.1 hypothetical protein QV13_20675 [Mesorhizobium hungaricum]
MVILIVIILLSFVLCAGLTFAMMPVFARYLTAQPNERSGHRVPTPQGGGAAVVIVTVLCVWIGIVASDYNVNGLRLHILACSAVFLAIVGALDDKWDVPPLVRFIGQVAAVAVVLMWGVDGSNILEAYMPYQVVFLVTILAGTWFINLVNFMDGVDLIVVGEMVPLTACIGLLGWFGFLGSLESLVAVALCGSLLGFALFNWPRAKLFLGDVGSLPIGLIVAWLLYETAAQGYWAVAILLPLYFCADATVTACRRLVNREQLWKAHRTHYYQRAADSGLSALRISSTVFALNLVLCALAIATVFWPTPVVQVAAVVGGGGLVGICMRSFSKRM